MSHRTKSRAGFSLIEALVVLAIIGLLGALLLPSLGRAREHARAAACAANVRSLQAANAAFAHDHEGRYAPGAIDEQGSGLHRWHGVRASAGEPFTPAGGSLTPYLGGSAGASGAVRSCPSFHVASDDGAPQGEFERGAGAYGYNQAFVGVERTPNAQGGWSRGDDARGAPQSKFRQPSSTIGFTDAALAQATLIEYSFVEPRFWPELPPAAGFRTDPSIHFRHHVRTAGRGRGAPGAASIAWLDGHVSAETRAFTWSSGVYAGDADALGLGWPGAADDNSLYDYD